jgi:hypothetical protein
VLCFGQATRRTFDNRQTSGLGVQHATAPAVPQVLSGGVVAQKNPPMRQYFPVPLLFDFLFVLPHRL